MAVRRRRARLPDRQRGEKHGWLRFDRYRLIHREVLASRWFVIEDRTRFTPTAGGGQPAAYACEGIVVCRGGLEIEVIKLLDARIRAGQVEVRGIKYSYHARVFEDGSGRNVLRYDSGHAHTPGVYHRHEYDPVTGEDRLSMLRREEFPVLSEMVDELAAMFPDAR